MHTEIEAKFLRTDHDHIRTKLKKMSATLEQPMRLMRRKNYDFADGRLQAEGAWVRARDEGDKITVSFKQLQDRGLHGTKEINLTVDSFEQADAFLQAVGLRAKTYQETKRESWRLGTTEIELDIWPWARPYIEIEGQSESDIRRVAKDLGLEWANAVHGSVEIVYRGEYEVADEEINTIPVITFAEPLPDWLERKRKAVA
jgi:adenylate cyclase, class 2